MTVLLDKLPVTNWSAAAWSAGRRYKTRQAECGTLGRYTYWGCRCASCRRAKFLDGKRRRAGKTESQYVPAVASVRRLQAMYVRGFTSSRIAVACRMGREHVQRLAFGISVPSRGIYLETADRIQVGCRLLLSEPVPDDIYARRARNRAAREGWVGLEGWPGATINDPDASPACPAARVPALATLRRLQALCVQGHATKRIATTCRVATGRLRTLLFSPDPVLELDRDTAERIRIGFERLVDEPLARDSNALRGQSRIRNYARGHGWQPPEAWSDASIEDPTAEPFDWMEPDYVDPVLVLKLLDRFRLDPMPYRQLREPAPWYDLSDLERRAVVDALERRGVSASQMSSDLGVESRIFYNWRKNGGVTVRPGRKKRVAA
jgi:hypothetical protein